MDRWREDLEYFVEWMLLCEVERAPSGKRQRQPMVGASISYGQGKGMRRSDLEMRRFICIEALKNIGGESITSAAIRVAGSSNPQKINVVRAGYYEVKRRQLRPAPGYEGAQLGIWFRKYLDWRNWVLYSPEEARQWALVEYRQSHRRLLPCRLEAILDGIRRQAGGPLIKLARMCRRLGPLGLSLLDHDMGALREHAGELIQRIHDGQVGLHPRADVDAGHLPVEIPYTYVSPVVKIKVGAPEQAPRRRRGDGGFGVTRGRGEK